MRSTLVLMVVVALALSACTAPASHPTPTSPTAAEPTGDPAPGTDHPLTDAVGQGSRVPGIDWTMPTWVRPAPNSGFYSEDAAPRQHVQVRSIDVSWAQISPTKGVIDRTASGEAQGMSFASLDDQLAEGGPYWMRIFASGTDWAPQWVQDECQPVTLGPDYDKQTHIPLWDECVWGHLMDTYRLLFVDQQLRDDANLRFIYVPGAYTWAEYDYEMINDGMKTGLTWADYKAWYDHAWTDLADIFGEQRTKLVFTGEDYPFSDFPAEHLPDLAKQATDAGLGIRTGIPELCNFHLSEAPAYGSRIGPDGHLSVDETLPIHDGRHVIGMENECFNDCGFSTDDPEYAVTQTNLKSLQLRANWVYVVPGPSYLADYADQWDWVRLSLGHTAASSADAWANLRDAEDTYWGDDAPASPSWPNRPWVRNLERWLVQVDVPGGVAHRSDVDVRAHVLERDNGTVYEGLRTEVKAGDTALYLALDERFKAATTGEVAVKVTVWGASGAFRVKAGTQTGPTIRPSGEKAWETYTVRFAGTALDGSLPKGTDLAIAATTASDVHVRLVRVVRIQPPAD